MLASYLFGLVALSGEKCVLKCCCEREGNFMWLDD